MRVIFGNIFKNVRKSERGGTLVYFGLAMPMILGFAGLGFDASMWFMERRSLQNATDASAMAAAYKLSRGGEAAALTAAANADSAINNFTVGGENTMLVENPPTSGDFAGQANFVMVTTSMPAEGFFSAAFGMSEGTIDTIATAGILAVGEHCILALSDTIDQAISMSGTADIVLDCGIASNSNSDQSIYLNGNVSVTADPSLQAFGDIYEGGSSTLNIPNPIQPFSQKVEDPYKDLTVPADPAACLETNYSTPHKNSLSGDPQYDSGAGTYTVTPGRYCGGLDLALKSMDADIVLDPGVYIVDGGDFVVNQNASIFGEDVTIILTGDSPGDVGGFDATGQPDIDLTAPSTGDYAGVLMYQDRIAEHGNVNKITGGGVFTMNGAVYFPSQEVEFLGNASHAGTCMMLIGSNVTMSGTSDTTIVTDDAMCTALGVKKASRTIVTLVE